MSLQGSSQRFNLAQLLLVPIVAILISAQRGAGAPIPSESGSIQAKLWAVSIAQASDVIFPAPSAIPDATFTTDGIAYIGQQYGADNTHCYTILGFLNTCGTPGYGFAFSGLPNSNLSGELASSTTPLSGSSYGIIIEFTGTISLKQGQPIHILHDDGVSLKIDGAEIPGFNAETHGPIDDVVVYQGSSGIHSFDLLYANSQPSGAWLLFGPALY